MSGLGQSSQQTSQQSQSQSSPWAPAQPELQSILGGIGGVNPQTTPYQQQALAQLMQNAGGIQNFTGQATGAANNFIGGDPTGLLSPAYKQYQQTMNPIAQASLNPMNTPGFSNALGTMNQDITNQVNGEFAGAGRSGSGLNTQQLARGISQGDSQAIANQYNQNVSNVQGASNGLLAAGAGTAGAMNQATGQGLGIAGTIPGFAGQTPSAMLNAAGQNYMLPLQQLGALENLTVPIAGLGGQSSGSSQGQTINQASPLQMMLGMFNGGPTSTYNGALGAAQGLGNAMNLGNLFPGFFPNF
jgi:hypothetical protein